MKVFYFASMQLKTEADKKREQENRKNRKGGRKK